MLSHAVPTDFAFPAKAGTPQLRRARSLARTVLRWDPFPSDDVVADFVADLHTGDPLAEAFVDEVFAAPEGRRKGRKMLDRALAHGIDSVPDAPASMKALFAEFETVPDWVDPELVEAGSRIWRRWGTDLFGIAGAETLEMYTESAIAVPLSLAGGYAGDNALRRFLETVRFWIDVSEPGALLTPGSAGRTTAMRVRVMHVDVRRRVAEHAEWDADRWGLPISQAWMMMTLLGGSLTPAMLMWPQGYQTTPGEIRTLLHQQRYLGHLLGARPRAYPQTVREALQVLNMVVAGRTYTAGEHGAELIESFPRAFAPDPSLRGRARIAAEYQHRLISAYTAMCMSPATRRRYDLPSAFPNVLLPLARFPLLAARELARRVVPPLDDALDRRSRAAREAWYRHHMRGREAAFDASGALRR